jgi:hypothetical protein
MRPYRPHRSREITLYQSEEWYGETDTMALRLDSLERLTSAPALASTTTRPLTSSPVTHSLQAALWLRHLRLFSRT